MSGVELTLRSGSRRRWRIAAAMMLLPLVSACANVLGGTPSEGACAALAALADAHAAALLEDAGDRAVVTGERLIAAIDAVCAL